MELLLAFATHPVVVFTGFTTIVGLCGYVSGLAAAKKELRSLQGQLIKNETDVLDLQDRFRRFQSRESMRKAREVKESEKTALEEAQAILAAASNPSLANSGESTAARKAGLRKARR